MLSQPCFANHALAKTKDASWQPDAVHHVRHAAWARWRRGGSCDLGEFLALLHATEPEVWGQNWPSSSTATLLRVSKTVNVFFQQHRFPMALCCNPAWRGQQLLCTNPAKRLELLAHVKAICAKYKVTSLTLDKCWLGAPRMQERLQSHRGGSSHPTADVAALVLVLAHCKHLEHLSLNGNPDLGEAWTGHLSEALALCPELEVLWLGGIGGGGRFCPLLTEKLSSMHKLKSLALYDNDHMETGCIARCFARALPSCAALESLDLDNCRLDKSNAVLVRAAWNRGQPGADGLETSYGRRVA
jgi:hypothetical protein